MTTTDPISLNRRSDWRLMGINLTHSYLDTEHVEMKSNIKFLCANNNEKLLVKITTVAVGI